MARAVWLATGAGFLAAGAIAWAVHTSADPAYDDDAERDAYAAAATDRRPLEGHLPRPEPGAVLASIADLELPTSARAEPAKGGFVATVVISRNAPTIAGDARPVAVFPQGLGDLAATGLPAPHDRDGERDM